MALLALVFVLGLAGCATAPRPPWPPRPGTPAARIIVYADHFHSIIGLPGRPGGHEEWAFGERIWFYDEKDTTSRKVYYFVVDALRALLWPNAGVIEVSKADKPYDTRNTENKVGVWQISVSEEGLARMRAYLDRSIGEKKAILDDGWQVYYSASRRYHVFHTCHHYVAGALREAGVPVHPSICVVPSGLWWQLGRVADKPPGRPKPVERD